MQNHRNVLFFLNKKKKKIKGNRAILISNHPCSLLLVQFFFEDKQKKWLDNAIYIRWKRSRQNKCRNKNKISFSHPSSKLRATIQKTSSSLIRTNRKSDRTMEREQRMRALDWAVGIETDRESSKVPNKVFLSGKDSITKWTLTILLRNMSVTKTMKWLDWLDDT